MSVFACCMSRCDSYSFCHFLLSPSCGECSTFCFSGLSSAPAVISCWKSIAFCRFETSPVVVFQEYLICPVISDFLSVPVICFLSSAFVVLVEFSERLVALKAETRILKYL